MGFKSWRSGQHQPGGQFFSEDAAKRAIIFFFTFEFRQQPGGMRHGFQLAPDGGARGGRKVTRGVFGAARDGSQGITGVGRVEQRLGPACRGRGRHHQVDRPVEQLAAPRRERHHNSLSRKSPALTRLTSASPSSVLVPSGNSSRLDAVRHISRSREALMRCGFLLPRGSRKADRRWYKSVCWLRLRPPATRPQKIHQSISHCAWLANVSPAK